MTRINVIPVEELSDQWLLAEYHELPRCIKQDINTECAPSRYKLGPGHMRWAKAHSLWLTYRYGKLIEEMKYRGFKPKYTLEELQAYWYDIDHLNGNIWYEITEVDKIINRDRLLNKYVSKPNYYRWTRRNKPSWISHIEG